MTVTTMPVPLEVSERRYRRLFESAHDGILILDAASGRILDVNPFLLALLEYKEEELLGKQPWEIGIFADIEANKAALKELQEKGQIRYEDLPLQTKNRQQRIDVEFVSNVYQEGDRAVIQCNIRDIRARKAAASVTSLEAERVNRMKDEFFARVSHELRAPLNVVLLWTQVLQQSSGNSEDLSSGLGVIARNARAQSRIIEDLLDVSRIVFGKLTCDCKPVNVVDVVSDAVEDIGPAATEKRIHLQMSCSGSEVAVIGDWERLRQVFANLLSNAIRLTPKGGEVAIAIIEKNSEVDIRIRDTGPGIPSEQMPRIFDRFRQPQAPAIPHHGGLGLGLTIVKELVVLHEGRVNVESQGEGSGATFTVTLPLARIYERGKTMKQAVAS